MQGAHTDRLIHFARTDGSLACGRLLDKEAGTSLTWPAVTCPDCLTARRRRQRNVILAGVGSGVTVIVVALVLWLVLSMDSQGEDAVAVEPETIPTAIAPIATATVAPATPEVDPTLAEIQLTKEPVEAAAMAQPRRGARLQWIESSPTLHLLVDAEHPDYALAKLEGRGNCLVCRRRGRRAATRGLHGIRSRTRERENTGKSDPCVSSRATDVRESRLHLCPMDAVTGKHCQR